MPHVLPFSQISEPKVSFVLAVANYIRGETIRPSNGWPLHRDMLTDIDSIRKETLS